jgi:integrase
MHDVPAAHHRTLGRRLTKSLGTPDRAQADRFASLLWLHDWSRQLRGIAVAKSDNAEAAFFKDLIRRAETEDEREGLLDHVANIASDRAEKAEDRGDYEGAKAAETFAKLATCRLTPLAEPLDEWLAGIGDTDKTKAMKRSTILKLAAAIPYAQNVDHASLQKWFAALAKDDGVSTKTMGRVLSFVRGYWKHLKSQSIVTGDPFSDLTLPQTRRSASWVPFDAAEVVALVKRARDKGDSELADLVTLGMWTGARIEELASLAVAEVRMKAKSFAIKDAKTAAGIREVPIHDKLTPTLRRLIGKRTSGYVLAGLLPNKYGDRSNAIGKRFGRLKKEAGFSETHVFHSIRKCVGTQLENALVPEGVSADILGHEKPNITYGIYSGGASLEVKRAALAKLRYPSPLEGKS